jgi:hypothetical protein
MDDYFTPKFSHYLICLLALFAGPLTSSTSNATARNACLLFNCQSEATIVECAMQTRIRSMTFFHNTEANLADRAEDLTVTHSRQAGETAHPHNGVNARVQKARIYQKLGFGLFLKM